MNILTIYFQNIYVFFEMIMMYIFAPSSPLSAVMFKGKYFFWKIGSLPEDYVYKSICIFDTFTSSKYFQFIEKN